MTAITDDDLGPLQPTKNLGVCLRSVERYRRELPGFPQPVKIRGRNYDYTRQIQKYKRELAAKAGA
jgi:hypothetical protein